LKNAIVAFFNVAKCAAKLRTEAQNGPVAPGLFCHRIRAMTQERRIFQRAAKPLSAPRATATKMAAKPRPKPAVSRAFPTQRRPRPLMDIPANAVLNLV
jgi:hypothetical protein